MRYQEVKGDLFKVDLDKYKLAHCISADVSGSKNMNKGIARLFRKKYPQMASQIFKNIKLGKAIRFQKNNHVIYNLIPKEKVGQKAQGEYKKEYYKNLENALLDMKNQMLKKGELFLAMPKIASGLDRGDWDVISKMIKEAFKETDIEIQIRYLEERIPIGGAFYSLEKAKSGRSTCKKCGKTIKKDAIRLKEGLPMRNYLQNQFYCRSCAIKKLKKMELNVEFLIKKINK